MKKTAVILTALVAISVAGCTVSGPTLRVKSPVEVKVEGAGSKHCPPGQAKKGNC